LLHALILACASGTTTTPPLAPTPEPTPAQQATPAVLSSVEYHFQDASVPPPYHRSVTIHVSLDSVDYVIDSYGDVVAEAHAPGSQATLDQAIAAYQAAGFALLPPATEPECTGGTSQSVKVKQGSLIAFSGTLSDCGASETGLTGDMEGFAQAIKALAPEPTDPSL
jgi:hypothetical protein